MTRTKAQATAGVWPNTGTGAGQADELIMSGETRKKTNGSSSGRGRKEDGGGELTSFAEARARAARQLLKPTISRGGGRGADDNGVFADPQAEAVGDDEHNAYDDDSDDDDDESTWSAVAGPLAGFTAPRSNRAVDDDDNEEDDPANAADAGAKVETRQRGDGQRMSGGNGCLIA